MKTIAFWGILFFLGSCQSPHLKMAPEAAIYDLASPIKLQQDTTCVYLSDYFLYPENIRKILVSKGLTVETSKEGEVLKIISVDSLVIAGNIKIRYEGYDYDIPVFSPQASNGFPIYTDELKGDTLYIKSSLPDVEWKVYLENYKLDESFLIKTDNRLGVVIPEEAKQFQRTHLRIWALDSGHISNDILIPLDKGIVVTKASELNRFDKRASTLYFLMIDRFSDADKSNNHPLNSPEVLPIADYMGGDLAGIIRKLKEGYFEQMGINTIWLSPITQNPEGAYGLWKKPRTKFSGYHGYWPVSSTKVDYRYGTSDELHELIEEAHKRDVNVILDYVANHVHQEHPIYKQHKDWVTDLYLPDGTLNTERWDDYRLTTWFDIFLPTLNLERKEVYEPMSDSALYWITTYGLDGFRHDATKHIPEVFWRTLTKKLKQNVMFPRKETIYQVGETYGSRDLIASYVGSGQMDGQFDFNVYDDAVPVFALPQEGFERLNRSLQESFQYYGIHNMMAYISGNQDRARFISYAAGDLSMNEDSKAAGWSRKIGEREPSDRSAYDKLVQLLAFNATVPGIPVIYYGDEIGMTGANDPDNRRMMRFDNLSYEENKVREKSMELNQLRRHHIALMYGDFIPLRVEKQIYAYMRSYFGQTVIVVFNKEKEDITLKLDLPVMERNTAFKSLFGNRFSYSHSKLILDIPPDGVEVIFN